MRCGWEEYVQLRFKSLVCLRCCWPFDWSIVSGPFGNFMMTKQALVSQVVCTSCSEPGGPGEDTQDKTKHQVLSIEERNDQTCQLQVHCRACLTSPLIQKATFCKWFICKGKHGVRKLQETEAGRLWETRSSWHQRYWRRLGFSPGYTPCISKTLSQVIPFLVALVSNLCLIVLCP